MSNETLSNELNKWRQTHFADYWILHTKYTLSDWLSEVIDDNTRQSYHGWVESQITAKYVEEEEDG